jgi:hypothetical protein
MTFATRVGNIDFRVPANFPKTAPWEGDVTLGDVMLHRIDVRIPPGHNGATGLQIQFNGVVVVPWESDDEWLVSNDESFSFPIETEVDTLLQLWGFNTGNYDHRFYCRFFYTPITLLTPLEYSTPIVPVA